MDDPIRLVVGLGNPGARYAKTRHNAGQRAVERLAERLGAGRPRARFGGVVSEARGAGGPVTLLVPTTFMNDSGSSVGPAMGMLKLAPSQVLVLHDEVDLPFGEVRGKLGGGSAGHNGVRSVAAGLGSSDFGRVRLGVGSPDETFRGTGADWVLARHAEPDEEVDALIERGADMARVALVDGLESAIDRFHAREPGSRAARRRRVSDADGDSRDGESPR